MIYPADLLDRMLRVHMNKVVFMHKYNTEKTYRFIKIHL